MVTATAWPGYISGGHLPRIVHNFPVWLVLDNSLSRNGWFEFLACIDNACCPALSRRASVLLRCTCIHLAAGLWGEQPASQSPMYMYITHLCQEQLLAFGETVIVPRGGGGMAGLSSWPVLLLDYLLWRCPFLALLQLEDLSSSCRFK